MQGWLCLGLVASPPGWVEPVHLDHRRVLDALGCFSRAKSRNARHGLGPPLRLDLLTCQPSETVTSSGNLVAAVDGLALLTSVPKQSAWKAVGRHACQTNAVRCVHTQNSIGDMPQRPGMLDYSFQV